MHQNPNSRFFCLISFLSMVFSLSSLRDSAECVQCTQISPETRLKRMDASYEIYFLLLLYGMEIHEIFPYLSDRLIHHSKHAVVSRFVSFSFRHHCARSHRRIYEENDRLVYVFAYFLKNRPRPFSRFQVFFVAQKKTDDDDESCLMSGMFEGGSRNVVFPPLSLRI